VVGVEGSGQLFHLQFRGEVVEERLVLQRRPERAQPGVGVAADVGHGESLRVGVTGRVRRREIVCKLT
jgi:hypothetical protein